MRKTLSGLLLLTLTIWNVAATPAKKGINSIKQCDGTEINIQLIGDEFTHYWATEDGIPVMRNQDGIYEYAILNEQNDRVMSNIKAKNSELRTQEDNEWIRKQFTQQITTCNSPKRAAIQQKRLTRPTQATKNLVILMNFKDKSFMGTDPQKAFSNLLNQKNYADNGGTGSVKDYFEVASNGKYIPQFDVYGPYTASQNLKYYGQNDSEGFDLHADLLIVEACRLADAAGVDFSLYDADKDGYVDNVSVFYAGYSEAEWAPEYTIWPHQYYLSATYQSITVDGKVIDSYVCMNELTGDTGSNMCGIGTFTHEFSHALGLPDLYSTNGTSHNTLGNWDVMDMGPYNNDGRTPPTYSAYERLFMGWITPEVLNKKTSVQLEALHTSNKAYIITSTGAHNLQGLNPSPALFYMLENRQKTGWDAYLPGHGLLITKINFSESSWNNNTVNNSSRGMGVDIVEADGASSEYGDSGDAFPRGANHISLFANYPITSIEENNGIITFDFMNEDDGFDDNIGNVSDECFTEQFSEVSANANTDIADELDFHCDNAGWEGTKVYADEQGLKMGSSKLGGTLTSPQLGMNGDIQVSVLLKNFNNDSPDVKLSVNTESSLSVSYLGGSDTEQQFIIKNATENTRITFATELGKQRFILYSMKACLISSTDVTSTKQSCYNITTQQSAIILSNLMEGEALLYNMMGQLMEHKTVNETCRFNTQKGVYLLLIKNSKGQIIGTEKLICQ